MHIIETHLLFPPFLLGDRIDWFVDPPVPVVNGAIFLPLGKDTKLVTPARNSIHFLMSRQVSPSSASSRMGTSDSSDESLSACSETLRGFVNVARKHCFSQEPNLVTEGKMSGI